MRERRAPILGETDAPVLGKHSEEDTSHAYRNRQVPQAEYPPDTIPKDHSSRETFAHAQIEPLPAFEVY